LLVAGDLAGKLVMGHATVFARKVVPCTILYKPEIVRPIRARLGEEFEAIGLMMIMLGFLIGIGVLALAASF